MVESRKFYADLLGLEAADRPELGIPGYWFKAGDGQVHLVGAPPGNGGIDPVGNHYCLAVDDLEGAVKELEVAGVAYLKAGDGDAAQVWVCDPAGNTIELQQERSDG